MKLFSASVQTELLEMAEANLNSQGKLQSMECNKIVNYWREVEEAVKRQLSWTNFVFFFSQLNLVI